MSRVAATTIDLRTRFGLGCRALRGNRGSVVVEAVVGVGEATGVGSVVGDRCGVVTGSGPVLGGDGGDCDSK